MAKYISCNFVIVADLASEVKTNETSSTDSQIKDVKGPNSTLTRDHQDQARPEQLTSNEIIDSWTWGNRPSESQLRTCLDLICHEQQKICGDAAGTTLFSYRFRQRSTVLKRYYIAQCRNNVKSRHLSTSAGGPAENDDLENSCELLEKNLNTKTHEDLMTSVKKVKDDSHGLARLGSRAALSFAFAFLRRAWRNGEDSDLCTELLQETLEALILLPPPSLFDESAVSSVWLEVVEKTSKFLRSVVMGEVSGDIHDIPIKDRNLALNLLLEFAVQKGALHEILDIVKLLLTLWKLGREDNRDQNSKIDSCAPLIPFLKRLDLIEAKEIRNHEEVIEDNVVSATEAFLRYLEYPQDSSLSIDLQQTAVVIMSHLDRLSTPHQPSLSLDFDSYFQKSRQNTIWAGQVSWNVFMDHSINDEGNFGVAHNLLGANIGPKELVLTSRGLIGLTKEGKMFQFSYHQDRKEVYYPRVDWTFAKLACSLDGSSLVALDKSLTTFVHWEFQHDHVTFEQPFEIVKMKEPIEVSKLVSGKSHFMCLNEVGDVFAWSLASATCGGTLSRMNTPISFENVPTLVTTLKGVKITDIACGGCPYQGTI